MNPVIMRLKLPQSSNRSMVMHDSISHWGTPTPSCGPCPSDSARPRLEPDDAAGGYCHWESKFGCTYVAKWTCKSTLPKQNSESPTVRVTPIQPPAVKLEMQTSQNADEAGTGPGDDSELGNSTSYCNIQHVQ